MIHYPMPEHWVLRRLEMVYHPGHNIWRAELHSLDREATVIRYARTSNTALGRAIGAVRAMEFSGAKFAEQTVRRITGRPCV